MSRFGTYTHETSVDVDIDIDDVIAELSDDELAKELERRKGAAAAKPAPLVPLDIIAELAMAYHETHSAGVPVHACHNVLCRDATRVLESAAKKKGEE